MGLGLLPRPGPHPARTRIRAELSIPAEAQLLEPTGVAVNETSGDIYVTDRGHNRVERFGNGGEFLAAWGWGVKGGTAYTVCAAGEGCTPRAEKRPVAEAFSQPEAIAVDNSGAVTDPSRGDVYVASSKGKPTVDKFGPHGEFLGSLFSKTEAKEIGETELGRIDGLAVDAHGEVWIAWGNAEEQASEITHYSDAVQNERVTQPEVTYEGPLGSSTVPRPGFAINKQGELYIDVEPYGSEKTKHTCQQAASWCSASSATKTNSFPNWAKPSQKDSLLPARPEWRSTR